MTFWTIIWYHIKACDKDLRARKLGRNLEIMNREGGQVFVRNDRSRWRLK